MKRGAVRGAVALACGVVLALPAVASAAGPEPGTPEYVQRDNQNVMDAYGRQFGPGGQVGNPAYSTAQIQEQGEIWWRQMGQQIATPTRIAITPGNVFPGWNGGNPLRRGWNGSRGISRQVAWTNRYGALIRGTVYAPLPGAKDPYTGARLKPPYPGVVITTGSIQGSEGMYVWLAQDLAERGYVVLTYDVQGQGTSETLPHENEQVNALPFCNPFAPPRDEEMFGCPGVPSQQTANFVFGTQDALSFFVSTPEKHYENPRSTDLVSDDTPVNRFNPFWSLYDRSKDRRSVTPGRRSRIAVIGHSLGASAVSKVQGIDSRVQVVVALDKLQSGGGSAGPASPGSVKPVVPALALQSEYGFNVQPYWANHGSSITPRPDDPTKAPDPQRELKTGFEAWRSAGVDSMLVVPRASTHLEYTDIAYVLPASRYGQALSSVYVQEWLDRYLKHHGDPPFRERTKSGRRGKLVRSPRSSLLAESFTYLEPVDVGKWEPVSLKRADNLSFYFCSAYALREPGTNRRVESRDLSGVGGC